jgi:hypothetical protein
MSNIQIALKSLTRLCGCDICKDLTVRRFTQDALEDTDCIVVTTMTITLIVRLAAGLGIDDSQPSLDTTVYRQCLRRMKLGWLQNEPPTIAEALDLIHTQEYNR